MVFEDMVLLEGQDTTDAIVDGICQFVFVKGNTIHWQQRGVGKIGAMLGLTVYGTCRLEASIQGKHIPITYSIICSTNLGRRTPI